MTRDTSVLEQRRSTTTASQKRAPNEILWSDGTKMNPSGFFTFVGNHLTRTPTRTLSHICDTSPTIPLHPDRAGRDLQRSIVITVDHQQKAAADVVTRADVLREADYQGSGFLRLHRCGGGGRSLITEDLLWNPDTFHMVTT